MDHKNGQPWHSFSLSKQKAMQANRVQAQHKDHCLYYRTHHGGLHALAMKYAKPVQQLNAGVQGPDVKVQRKLKD
jgi:hypothetical protein